MSEAFNKQELLEELDGDREFLQESVEILAADAPPLLSEITRAIESGDADAAARHAHAVKSMVGNFCATPAFDAALEVETRGRSGDLAACRTAVVTLEREVSRLQQALHDFLDEVE